MDIQYITYEDHYLQGYEIFELENSSSQISLRGDSFESAILFEGQPIAFHWSDCQGSVDQYLVRSSNDDDPTQTLKQIRQLVNDETSDLPLSQSLEGLLSMFEPGQYLLKAIELDEYDYLKPKKSHCNYYPYEDILISTQPSIQLNEEAVLQHMKSIKAGKKPKLITASVHQNIQTMYVLDGHHKLEAYQRLEQNPHVIHIISVSAQPISLEEGLGFASYQQSKALYEKVKKAHHNNIKSNDFRFKLDHGKKLFDAIFNNDQDQLKQQIQTNPDLIAVENSYGLKALHYATQINHIDSVKTLINLGANINDRDRHDKAAVHYAIDDDQIDALKELVALGANINAQAGPTKKSPLDRAISWGLIKNALAQIELGADPTLSTQDLIAKAACRHGGLSLIKILVEQFGFKPTKDHQKNTMIPELRRYFDQYLLQQNGEGANIIYDLIKAGYKTKVWKLLKLNQSLAVDNDESSEIKIHTVSDDSKIIDSYPIVPCFNPTELDIRNIKHWKGSNKLQAEITAGHADCFTTFDFIPVDYAENQSTYGKGGTQKVCLSAIAASVKLPFQAEEAYVAMVGEVQEKDYHLWSEYSDFHASIMGKVLSIKKYTLQNQNLLLLTVKLKLTDDAKDFYTLPVLVHQSNIKISDLAVGSLIESKVIIQGRLDNT